MEHWNGLINAKNLVTYFINGLSSGKGCQQVYQLQEEVKDMIFLLATIG